jgi:hypothetical protein
LVVLVACVTHIAVLALATSHRDFFAIWSWARFEIEHPAALIYNHAAQHAFLLSLDPTFPSTTPFPYPPLYLLLIRPLGWLPFPVAEAVWIEATLLAYIVAVCAPAWRRQIMLLALLAPATAINISYGQNGFLTAALMIGGIRLAPSWPFAGGVLLGLLAYKPQFGLLVGIALVAAGLWRTALAAALTVAAAVAASLFAFGLDPWTAWANSMPDFVAFLDSDRTHFLPLMPTALANVLALGGSDRLAEGIQFAATAAAATAVWFAFKRAAKAYHPSTISPAPRGGNDWAAGEGRAAVLATASILASPYAFVYDLTLVAAAVVFVVAEYWTTLSAMEMLVLGVAVLVPANSLLPHIVPPVSAAVLGLLLALILLRCRRAAFRASGLAVDRLAPTSTTRLGNWTKNLGEKIARQS